MPSFHTRHRVAHSPRQMYDLVADITRYPEFLPMCTGLTVLSRRPTTAGGAELTARMSVGYQSISEAFTTRVHLEPDKKHITASYIDGPFKYLDNDWMFYDAPGGGTLIDFDISYEFESILLGMLVGAMFEQALRKFTHAFEERAYEIYGPAEQAISP